MRLGAALVAATLAVALGGCAGDGDVAEDITGGVLADAEAGSLGVLAERMQANAHDCVAFTGPASTFEVPVDVEFDRF